MSTGNRYSPHLLKQKDDSAVNRTTQCLKKYIFSLFRGTDTFNFARIARPRASPVVPEQRPYDELSGPPLNPYQIARAIERTDADRENHAEGGHTARY